MAAALILAALHAGTASAAHVARLDICTGTVPAGGEVTVFGRRVGRRRRSPSAGTPSTARCSGRSPLMWWDFGGGAGLYATLYYAYSYDNGESWSRNSA